jgi:YHS domain-containing protein
MPEIALMTLQSGASEMDKLKLGIPPHYRNYPSARWAFDAENGETSNFTLRGIAMTIDPVCGMKVDENNSQYQTQYGGKQYNFCSADCKKKFEQQPEKYARSAA